MLNIVENIIISLSIITALGVIFVNNPVQSLLFLILTFAFSSMLFLILGIEFISLLIFMVYIGAIAVLFLFIVMMLNIKIVELRNSYLRYLPVGSFIILFFFLELCIFFYVEFFNFYFDFSFIDWIDVFYLEDNIYILSSIIYTYFFIYFFILALILLVSMIGSIVLVINWSNITTNKNLYYNIKYYKKNSVFFFK